MNALRNMVPLLLLGLLTAGCSELRDPEPVIEERLLSETPLGSSKDEVRSYLVSHLGVTNIIEEEPGVVELKEPFESEDWGSLLRVYLGGYSFLGMNLLATDVVAFYVFSESGGLVEVAIVKYHEGL